MWLIKLRGFVASLVLAQISKFRAGARRSVGRRYSDRRLVAGAATVAALTLGLVVAALPFSSPARAQSTSSSCADPVTSPPTGPATVSAASTAAFGRVLVVGSGDYKGCSLYLLTSDELHALSGAPFACSDNPNAIGAPCDTVLWPALLTKGAPIAGRGVNPTLLRTVTRTDLPGMSSVQQVTYAGLPLYRFFLDEKPGETEGANLFDPVTAPTGIWYLVEPGRGRPAPGQAHLLLETAPVGGTGPDATVLAASMNNDFSLFPHASFPVYTLSPNSGHQEGQQTGDQKGQQTGHQRGHDSACQETCELYWPPVLTSKRPEAGPGVDHGALGIIVRPDGTHQVTYRGQPLYLFVNDAYIQGLPYGEARIDGAGAHTPWGVFNTIPPLP
jgi:predicted lipoprotein with Yx(FWY)xxD motif